MSLKQSRAHKLLLVQDRKMGVEKCRKEKSRKEKQQGKEETEEK